MNKNRFRLLLYPFSIIFAVATSIRNWLFDYGILKSTSYSIPVISVGNITVGGTGKTPLTELILRHLEKNKRSALLSRGYGRKTKGVIIADDKADYFTIGDEPMQIKSKFKDLMVIVAEKRRKGMMALLERPDSPEVVVLDDAFQHRYVKPGLSILVMDYYRPVWKDFCLPAGNLRESVKGMRRADLIVVNKCPSGLSETEAAIIQKKLRVKVSNTLFFTSITYGLPTPLVSQSKSFLNLIKESDCSLIAMAGIGNPEPFFTMVKKFNLPVNTLRFPDHHDFTTADLKKMENLCFNEKNKESLLLTTEKDAIRLLSLSGLSNQFLKKIWYIPIELKFLFEGQPLFEKKINNYVGKN